MTGESILIGMAVGLFAGWLVELVAQGTGLGLFGTLTLAMFGGIVGALLLPMTSFDLGSALLNVTIDAGLGAAVILLIVKVMRRDDDHAGQPK
jgi:uncharacterized membrane protein YeaQ/YmgE (transglycosylase-associated protein family)